MQITLDEGYQFGLGVFETIAVEQGRPILLSWHLERLNASLKVFGIDRSVGEADVMEYLAVQEAPHHALKLMVSDANQFMTLRPNHYTPEQYHRGFRLIYSPIYRNETSPLVCHKTFNYSDCILEKRRAVAEGADEVLFVNSRGEICEGSTTNLFFVQSGNIYTPPLSCGLLPGILRRFILEHFPVTERILYREDLASMDECFVTNSLMGIMPVTSIEAKTFTSHVAADECSTLYRAKCLPV
jgi:4-amino-4-deoxychorismate lyase